MGWGLGDDHPSSPFGSNNSGLESSKIVFRQWFDESLLQFFFCFGIENRLTQLCNKIRALSTDAVKMWRFWVPNQLEKMVNLQEQTKNCIYWREYFFHTILWELRKVFATYIFCFPTKIFEKVILRWASLKLVATKNQQ